MAFQYNVAANNVKKIIETKLWKQAIIDSYFNKFMGESDMNVVQTKTDLSKEKASKETFTIRKKLIGAGVTGYETLEGKEEDLSLSTFDVTLEMYRHATAIKNGLTAEYDNFNLPAEAKQALQDWMTERIDGLCFDAYYSATPAANIVYAGAATSIATIQATELISPALLDKLNVIASTGNKRAFNPLRPVKINGKNYYILLASKESLYDLRRNSEMLQAFREAEVRGSENPIFSGAELIYNGIIVHSHERVFTADNGGAGSNISYAKNLLLGAQSLVWSWGRKPEIKTQTKDYDMISGFAIQMIGAAAKPTFDSVNHGMVEVRTARTKLM